MLGMWDVGCLLGYGMLIYKIPVIVGVVSCHYYAAAKEVLLDFLFPIVKLFFCDSCLWKTNNKFLF